MKILFPIALFCFVVGCVALTINAKTQRDFNLQQIGVEALVERHTFALEGSHVPELQPLGDTFGYHGHIYAIKQPGQFVLGAIVYSLLRPLGITYQQNYVLTAALVTLGSSGILLGLLTVTLYRVALHMTESRRYSAFVAIVTCIGTILLPYAGVAHHDVQAAAIIFIGWSLIYLAPPRSSLIRFCIAGFLVAGSLFISMLPIAVCVCVGLYLMRLRELKQTVAFIAGLVFGVLPVFLYNQFLFGSLLAFPNFISGVTDTSPFLSLENIVDKLYFYLLSPAHSLFLFSPILLCAAVGLFLLPKKFRSEKIFLTLTYLLHLFYLASITTIGDAQYGPRYLLPLLPFLGLGLAGLYKSHVSVKIGMIFFALVSIVISGVGALGGVMYQTIWIHPFPSYLSQILRGESSPRPLWPIGFLLLSLSLSISLYATRVRRVEKA